MIQEYLRKMKMIEENLLEFLDDENSDNETFETLIIFLKDQQIHENQKEFKIVLNLISNLSNNHHRAPSFQSKIERILNEFKDEIHQNFSNIELFTIFKSSKLILLFLLKEKILIANKNIFNIIRTNSEFQSFNYQQFFTPEFAPFFESEIKQELINELFNQKRSIGENDSYICQLIRNDSIDDFIVFVNKNNLSLLSTINESIFETNSLLNEKKPTFIEYAAFFGSIQIFRYLYMNKNELLTPSLWIYAIHGRNPSLIHLLEENSVKPKDETFNECLVESIKCHHKEITEYIELNLLKENQNEFLLDSLFISKSLEYFNFAYLNEFDDFEKKIFNVKCLLYYLCKFDYFQIVHFLLSNKSKNMQSIIVIINVINNISKSKSFYDAFT